MDGASPSMGSGKYYSHDILDSVQGIWDSGKALTAQFQYAPYGESFNKIGETSEIARNFTGHDLDARTGLLFAPQRYYSPARAIWLTRDPLGMVDGPNLYGYVGGRPTNFVDKHGTQGGPAELGVVVFALIRVTFEIAGAVLVIDQVIGSVQNRRDRKEFEKLAKEGLLTMNTTTSTVTYGSCRKFGKYWGDRKMVNGECRCYYERSYWRYPSRAEQRQVTNEGGRILTHIVGSDENGTYAKWYTRCKSETMYTRSYELLLRDSAGDLN